jgi:hypothetical protein
MVIPAGGNAFKLLTRLFSRESRGPELMEELAKAYIQAVIFPERRQEDALHVAAATCIGADYVVRGSRPLPVC